ASGGRDRTVRLWELATGKERHRCEGHLGPISKLAFSADGRILASASGDTSVLVWSVRGSPRQRVAADLSPDRLNSLWNDLASDDASKAYQAMATLSAVPKQTATWLQQHLPASTAAAPPQMARLIADLDAERFAVREKAEQELE